MTYFSVSNPFMQVLNLKGTGLNDGDVYFGVAGQDPEDFPVQVYWDAAATQPADQPIPTTGGYLFRSGSPAAVYFNDTYSIKVLDKNGALIYYQAEVLDPLFEFIDDLAGSGGSSLVGFIQAGSGAVARTVQAKARETISVKDFGAIGDGAADDTTAIQAAITYAESLSPPGAVYFPHGTYKIVTALSITTPIMLHGDGPGESVITCASNIDMININIASSAARGMVVRDLALKQTLAYASLSAGTAIKMAGSYVSRVSNVLIINAYNAIDIALCPLSTFNGFELQGFKNIGVRLHGGGNYDDAFSDFIISGNNGASANGVTGISLEDQNEEHRFLDGVVSTCTNAMITTAASAVIGFQPAFCHFEGVSFDTCATGPKVDFSTDINFDDCLFGNRPGNGFEIGFTGATRNVQFINCSAVNNGTNGGVVGAFARDTTFVACKFIGNSQIAGPGVAHGLVIQTGADGVVITGGNKFGNTWPGAAGTQGFGLYIPGPTNNSLSITGNNFDTTGGGALSIASTGADQIIANNLGYRTFAKGTINLTAGNAVVVLSPIFPSANYALTLSTSANETLRWSGKGTGGFSIASSNAGSTAPVDWTASL